MRGRSGRTFGILGAIAVLVSACARAPGTSGGGGGAPAPGPSPVVERLAGGFEFLEGPVFGADGTLRFSDTRGDAIHQLAPDGKLSVFRRPAGQPNGLAYDREGRLLTCEHGNRRVSRTELDGRVVTLADRYEGRRLNSPNDLVVARDGTVYFTDPPYGLPDRTEGKELDFNGVFRWRAGDGLQLLTREFKLPNGIQLSPDERRLYVNEAGERIIRMFDVTADGGIANGREFARLTGRAGDWSADGLEVDRAGNVYAAGPGGVWIFAPDGRPAGRIATPEPVTNLALDPTGIHLYLTGVTALYRVRVEAPAPI